MIPAVALLGSHPDLSCAELTAVVGTSPRQEGMLAFWEQVPWGDAGALMARLGGTRGVGRIIAEVPLDAGQIAETIVAELLARRSEGKLPFAISVEGEKSPARDKLEQGLQRLHWEVKERLRTHGRNGRVVRARGEASAVALRSNNVIRNGGAIVLLPTTSTVRIAFLDDVQDAIAWSQRDYGRPRRNAKQGMLPPKLARMLLNLAEVPLSGVTVLDPFCGSGTILMEAALIGAGQLIASDKNSMATRDTTENFAWLQSHAPQTRTIPLSTFACAAANIPAHCAPGSINLIASETWLGSPRTGKESAADIHRILNDVESVWRQSFSALRPLLAPEGRLILTAPVHYLGTTPYTFDAIGLMQTLGYRHLPLPNEPLIYRRDDQFVGRNIFRFGV